MDLGLKDKVVVITGGTAGIGKGLVPAFLAEGCKVAVCGRNPATNDKLKQEYPDVLVVRADVSKLEDLSRLAEETVVAFGGIDVWINNAGIMTQGNLIDIKESDLDALLNINVKGVFMGTRVAVPYLEKRGGGVVINASSFSTVLPSAGSGAYAASKMAVNALTQAFAAELAPRNIRVVSYIPGVFDTPMNVNWIANCGDQLIQPIALHRYGLPEEIAPAVVFLASNKAGYITGTAMQVTGGKFCVQNPAACWA